MSVAQPALPGAGITVRILRDDGTTYAGATLPPELFRPGALSAKVAAATGLSAGEQARARNLLATLPHSPREPVEQGLGWAVYSAPSGLSAFVQRDDGTHLSWSAPAPLFSRSKAATAISATTGLSGPEISRLTGLAGGTVASASSPTVLPSLGTLVARWSPDDLVGLANNDPVGSFPDSISGITLTQATGANKPIYKTGGANGKPYLLMAAAKNLLVTTDPTLNAAMSDEIYTVLVFYRNVTASAFSVVACSGNTNNWFAGSSNYTPASSTTYSAGMASQGGFRVPYDGSVGSAAVQSVGSTSGYNAGGAIGNFQQVYLNGCSMTTGGGNAASDNGTFSIGISASANSVVGEIYDVLIWSSALSPQDMIQAHKWACEKYSQTPTWVTYGKMYVALGSSQASGTGATIPAYEGYVNKAARDAGIPIGAYTIAGYSAQGATTLSGMAAQGLYNLPTITGIPCNLSWLEYYNTRGQANPGTLVLTAIAGIKAAGFNKIGLFTLTDYGTGAADFGVRTTFISDLVAGYAAAGASDMIRLDLDGVINVSGVGLRTAGGGTAFAGSTYFIGDLIHQTTLGHATIASYLTPVLSSW